MKILHTSDWHFGRTLLGADLTAAFEQWADFLVQTVREREIDAVLISGDVYDRGIPPVTMVDLLSHTLARLTETAHVVLTSGNHDSAKRLGFGSALMRPELMIRTDSRHSNSPVVLPNRERDIGAIVYPIPYLDPDVERTRLVPESDSADTDPSGATTEASGSSPHTEPFPDSPTPSRTSILERSHQAVLGEVMRRIRADILRGRYSISSADAPLGKVPRIVMAHAFVTGSETSESEQDIHVGGADSVPSSLFDIRADSAGTPTGDTSFVHQEFPAQSNAADNLIDGGRALIDYVALGHLHGPQRVNREGQPIMRYSGSPVAFSFSEEHHVKSAVFLECESGNSTPHIELIEAPVYRPLATIRDSFENLRSSEYGKYKNMFVRAYVTDPSRPRDLVARLRKVFPYLLQVHHDTPAMVSTAHELQTLKTDPLGTLREFFTENGGRNLNNEEEKLLEHLWHTHSGNSAGLCPETSTR